MRIVILARSTTAHRFGGIETHAASLARGAARLGHEIIVLSTSHPSGLVEEQRDGAWYRYLPGTPPAVYTHAWRVESVRAVANLVRAADVDLVLSLGLSGCGLADARLGVPHHVIAYGEVLAHVVSEWHEAHGFRGLSAYPKHALATLYYAWLERRLWSRVDSVVATDERLRRRLCRLGYRARLAYTGIALEAFAPDGETRAAMRRRLAIAENARVMLMVSTVNRQKGVWLGARVFASLAARDPRLHLVLVGDGSDLPAIRRQLADPLRRGRAHLAGAVTCAGVPPYYAAADVFVAPTLRMEGLPLTVIEAAAAGLPIVASARGGMTSAIEHGVTGLLVKPGDARALETAILRLVDDPALAASLGCRARQLALERFDEVTATERMLGDLTSGGGFDAAR